MSIPPLYGYLGRTNNNTAGGGGVPAMPNAFLPSNGAAMGYTRRGGEAAKKKHALRQCEKDVLIRMIKSAVPLDSSANSIDQEENGGTGDVTAPILRGATAGTSTSPPVTWRLLIFDDWGRDIIAPLLKVADLRELGVTLYMHIKTDREPVPGAPAIYLCAPTIENIEQIVSDCAKQLYEWVYLNFTTQVSREMLEHLARALSETSLPSIEHLRLFDRMLSYVALDEDLFSLMLPHSFLTLNRQKAEDSGIDAHLNDVVTGVLHVLLALQAMPVVVHSRTGAAEEVARRLSGRLRDAVKEHLLSPAPAAPFGRPLLVIVDRSTDFATALHHTFSYRGLLVDQAGMRLNKCHIHTESGKDEVFEIDPERDHFYAAYAGLGFGEIGAKIEAALKAYKDDYAALATESTTPGADGETDANSMSRLLASAPLLAERKRYLDMHTQLAYSFLKQIRTNGLDRLHGVELELLRRGGLDKEEFTKLLSTRTGTLADRQRLYLIAHLMCGQPGGEEGFVQQQLAHLTEEMGAETGTAKAAENAAAEAFPALAYLKHLRSWSLASAAGPNAAKATARPAGGGGSGGRDFGWGFAQQLAKNIAHTLSGAVRTELPLTRLLEALLQEPTAAAGGGGGGGGAAAASSAVLAERAKLLETVDGVDPLQQRAVHPGEVGFSQAVVFVLGGGSVAEYDDLKRWEAAHPSKVVSYGCTAILSGEEMLRELSVLGAELR